MAAARARNNLSVIDIPPHLAASASRKRRGIKGVVVCGRAVSSNGTSDSGVMTSKDAATRFGRIVAQRVP